jgi:hypothetical protein
LKHIYVLIPVFDAKKHYWVGADEVDKLLRMGEGWLDTHPAKDYIVKPPKQDRVKQAIEKLTAQLVDEEAPPK